MPISNLVCARCARSNHPSERFCVKCGLPLGSVQPDAGAGGDALGPFEAPEPADPDTFRLLRELVVRSGFEASPSGHGWRIVVPLQLDRHQAIYIGHAGTDPEGRSILGLVSVCGPVSDRDTRILLKLNARSVEGHFAIKVLRGEEYFVVIRNLPADSIEPLDANRLVRRIAEMADGLEDRLSRGRDLLLIPWGACGASAGNTWYVARMAAARLQRIDEGRWPATSSRLLRPKPPGMSATR